MVTFFCYPPLYSYSLYIYKTPPNVKIEIRMEPKKKALGTYQNSKATRVDHMVMII